MKMDDNGSSLKFTLNGQQLNTPTASGDVESSSSNQVNLPEVVGKLFMLDDNFFRSPFLREKLPPLLFSNGTHGFDTFFRDMGPPPQSAREIFNHGGRDPRAAREDEEEDDYDSGEGPPTPTFESSNSSYPGPGRYMGSGPVGGPGPRNGFYEAPSRLRNLNEPENFAQNNGQASAAAAAAIVRNIPIKIEGHFQQPQPLQQSRPEKHEPAYSHLQTPHFAAVSASVTSPTFSVPASTFKETVPVPKYSSGSVKSENSLGVRFFDEQPKTGSASGSPVKAVERSVPIQANYKRDDPDVVSFRSFQFPSEERAAENFYRSNSSGRLTPPEPPQRRSFSYLLKNNQHHPRPLSESFEKQPQQTQYSSELTSSMPTYRNERERPTTPLSQKSRPKSPSLQTIRNGLKKATYCVRKPTGSNDNSDADYSSDNTAYHIQPSSSNSFNQSQSSSLYATINKPTRVENNHSNVQNNDSYDAVEEAIRSLESFDPSKIIQEAQDRISAFSYSANNEKSSASDSDTGSVIVRNEPPKAATVRETSIPIQNGANNHYNNGNQPRTWIERDRYSGNSGNSGNSGGENSSLNNSSDTDAGSYILVDPQKHQFKPPVSSKAQPPAVARVAFAGSFAGAPQRAIYSSPSGSNNSTLTRNENPGAATGGPASVPAPGLRIIAPPPDVVVAQEDPEEEDAATMRKRILCAQMTDCAKVIEINGLKMNQFTSLINWRHPAILQRNLSAIQDTVYIIEAALDELIEFTQRVSIVRSDPKYDEFGQMIAPLRTSQNLIHRLRGNLDSSSWALGTLARVNGMSSASDSLDQFVAILQHLPKDCRKMVQWIYLLGTPKQGGAQFLPRHSPGAVPFPVATPTIDQMRERNGYGQRLEPEVPESLRPKSLLRPGQPQPQPHPQPQVTNHVRFRDEVSPILPKPFLQPPTIEEIAMDGGESTSSNGSGGTIEVKLNSPGSGNSETSSATPTIENSRKGGDVMEEDDLSSIADPKQVYEEDDLMSVISDSSLYQDYSFTGDSNSLPRPVRPKKNPQNFSKISQVLLKDLSDEERELLKFYAPQLENHTTGLSKLIDEFFNVVEQTQEPSKFVQKIRLIILEAQTLVYIGDNMAQCVVKPVLRAEFRHASDKLNGLLTQCVTNARIAKDQYPNVQAVQTLINSVFAVSDAAQNLKQLGKSCG